jgi:hypothetical protein
MTKYIDKMLHFLIGMVIAVLVWYVTKNPAFGVLAAAVTGTLKEGYDAWDNKKRIDAGVPPRHGVEFLDFLATFLGGVAWYVFVMVVK